MSKTNKHLAEISNLDQVGLFSQLEEACKLFFELRLKHKAGQLSESHLLRNARKKIARLKTAISQQRGGN